MIVTLQSTRRSVPTSMTARGTVRRAPAARQGQRNCRWAPPLRAAAAAHGERRLAGAEAGDLMGVGADRAARAGRRSARRRIRRAVERAGSGIMLVGFLVLALFA